MKANKLTFLVFSLILCAALIGPVRAAVVTKASSGTDLTAGASWGGTAPGSADTAMWTNSSLGAGLALGTSKAWGGIAVSNAASDIFIGSTGALTNGSGGIDMSASAVNLTITNPIVLGASQTWTVVAGKGLTNLGTIANISSATLTKAGAGTLSLGGTISLTNSTSVNGGTLNVSSNFNTYANRVLAISSGAVAASASTLYVNVNQNGSHDSTNVAGAGTLRLASTSNGTNLPDIYFGSDVSGTSYYGAWINPATLDLGSSQRFIFAKTGHNSISQYYPNTDAAIGSSIIGSGGITYIAQMSYAASNPMEVPLALVGSNSFTGPLEIQRGSIYQMNPNALTQTNTLFLNSSGTNNARFFLFGNNVTVGNLSSSAGGTNLIANANVGNTNAIATNAVTLTVNQSSNTTYSGVLVNSQAEYDKGTYTAGALSLAVTGSSKLTLTASNTYTGTTTINGGTLEIGGPGVLGNGTYSNLITNNATFACDSSANQTLSGVISGIGLLVKSNTSTLSLTGSNTYSGGTAFNGGTLSIGNGTALGTGTLNVGLMASGTLTIANTNAVTVNNNLVLPAPGSAVTFNIVKNSPGISTGTQLNLAGNVSGGNANTTLFLNSNTGSDNTTTYRFAGTNTFLVNRVELNRGGIVVVNAASMGDPSNLVYLDGNNHKTLGDLRFETSMTFPNPIQLAYTTGTYVGTDTNNVALTGLVSGLNLIKLGSGTMALNGGNTYTGNTTVNGGTLAFGAAGTMPPGAVITVSGNTALDVSALASPVLSGSQTLQGGGTGTATVAGNLQDSAGTIIIPGGITNVGTLAITGNLTLAGADTLNFDLGKTPTSAGGTNNDLITIASNLTINTDTTVNINPSQLALAGGTYKLISYGGTLNGAGNTASWIVGGYTPSGRVTGVAISEATPGEIDLIVTGSPAPLVWQGDGSGNAWDVQTTTNWLNGGTPDYFYQFDNALFTDTGSNSPAVDIQAAVTPSSVVVSNNVENYTFNSSVGQGISGGGTLTKSGTGTLTILNNNNPYTGITTINNGALVLGDGVSNDGSLSASPIVNNATLKFNVASAQTAAAAISGSGTVVQAGNLNGTLTLNASNSWTGGLTIQSGTAKPGVNYALPAGESVTITAGGAYDFNGIANGSTTTRAYSFTIAGAGPDSTSGAMVNSGGNINTSASVSNLTLSANATVGGSGRWDIGSVSNSMLNGNGFVLTKAGGNLMDLAPQIMTNVASIQITSGNLFYQTYNQTNPWTANITNYVASGAILGIYGSQTINVPILADGGTIDNQGSGTPVWSGPVSVTANSAILSTASGSQILSGSVNGPGGLTVQGGTYSVTLSGSNSFTGGTTINAGTLVVANGNALGTGNATINTGALYFNFPSGTTNVVTNDIALPATGTQEFTLQGIPTNFTTVHLTGVISGGTSGLQYNLVDTGVTGNHSSVLVLDNTNNSFSGNILMNRGSLAFTSDAALGNLSNAILFDTWNTNGALRFAADNITLNSSRTITLAPTGNSGNVQPVDVQGFTGTIAGAIGGAGQLIKQGTGTLILTGNETYTGATTVSAGLLLVNGSTGTSTITVSSNAVLGGLGIVGGATTVQKKGTIQGGDANYSSTLTVPTLNLGTTNTDVTYSWFKVATGGIVAATTLNVSGTNLVNILDVSLPYGTNTLFTYTGSIGGSNGFGGLQLGTVPSGVAAQLLNTGSAVQFAITPLVLVNTNPPVLTNIISGSTLTLSWPADHLGWELLVQTNSLNAGLGTNWFAWPNTTNLTSVPITLDPSAPAVFFKLVYPPQ